MENFSYYAPTKVIFGKGSLEKLADECLNINAKKIFIVYGSKRIEENGLLEDVKEKLENAQIEYFLFGGVKANPSLEYALVGIDKARSFCPDLILAIGGGSVIDTAKAISVGTINDIDIWDAWCGKVKFNKTVPVSCILTIPAAGSEMSNSAVLTNEKLKSKRGLSSDLYRCKFAIMDPVFAMTLPKKQIACGIVDTMLHTIERYFYPKEKQHNHMSDEIAEGLLRNVIKYGKILYSNQTNYEAMSEIMWASSLSHNDITGLGGGKDFSVHQLGHEISAMFDITHGESLSAIWASWCRYVFRDDIDRFAKFAKNVWGSKFEGIEAAIDGINKTEAYFKSLNMPISIGELSCGKLDEKIIDELALKCTRNETRKIGVFKPLDLKMVKEVYNLANF